MADTTIEWAEKTWNPTVGCSRVSEGCRNCYAEKMAWRQVGMKTPGYEGVAKKVGDEVRWTGVVRTMPGRLEQPMRWRKPRRVFVNSMSDLFHESVPFTFVAAVFGVMAECPRHTFMILTKRPERMAEFYEWLEQASRNHYAPHPKVAYCWHMAWALSSVGDAPTSTQAVWPLPNVQLGVSVEDQGTADERIPLLLGCPAAVRFVSYEPALGPINFRWKPWAHEATGETYRQYLERMGSVNEYESIKGIDGIIMGGESGPGARAMHPDWARGCRDACVEAGVNFFFKQWGGFLPSCQVPAAGLEAQSRVANLWRRRDSEKSGSEKVSRWVVRSNGIEVHVVPVGKKLAGRLLDGRVWDELPGCTTKDLAVGMGKDLSTDA